MKTLYSSALATVMGAAAVGGVVFGAATLAPVAVKSDRLPVMEKVTCIADCVENDRFDAAFDIVASHDVENVVTTLTRIRP